MVRNSHNHWVFGLCSWSGILNNFKARRFGSGICFRPRVGVGRDLLFWVLQKELTSITGRWAKSRNTEILSYR
jgi:hypothetical protein